MEVFGKRSLTDTVSVFCKHCGDEDIRVPANGLCRECEEHMCLACFNNHKTYKVCKDHALLDIETQIKPEIDREEDAFVPCPKHVKEQVKFYCKCHDDVGCGDCIILYHKSCKIDYIADISSAFSASKEFVDTVQHVGACQTEINECFESIQNNKIQVDDIYQGFISELKSFRDELISKLDKQEAILLEEANNIQRKQKNVIVSLETECKELKDNLAQINNNVSSNCSETTLFVNTIQSKRAIKEIQHNLSKLKSRNTISKYNFRGNDKIEELLKTVELGGIQIINDEKTTNPNSQEIEGKDEPVTSGTQSRHENENSVASLGDGYENHITFHAEKGKSDNVYEDNLTITETQEYEDLIYEEIPESKITRKRRSPSRKNLSLLGNPNKCENIVMAGEIISFNENNKGGTGLFIGKRSIKKGTYFQVEIINTTDRGNISIGFVPKDYSSKEQPGDGRFSVGYHTVDGCIHCDTASRKRISPPCKIGDVIGIGVSSHLSNLFKTSLSVFVTRNSQKIGSMDLNITSFCKLYSAVGLKAINDKGIIIMDAELR